jgi:hypothetical protein
MLGPMKAGPARISTVRGALAAGLAALALGSLPACVSADPPALPVFDGLMSFKPIAGPLDQEEFSWEMSLGEEQSLRPVDDRHAEVFYSGSGYTALEITATAARDATGKNVPTTLIVPGGNVITLVVHHRAGNPAAGGASFNYPVIAGDAFELGQMPVQIVVPPDGSAIKAAEVGQSRGDAGDRSAAGQGSRDLAAEPCGPVVDPYPGSRYEGVDLTHLRATEVSCPVARHVARSAHRKALRLPLPPSGVLHFSWHGWRVTGDLRPSSDVYVAKLGEKRVGWRF